MKKFESFLQSKMEEYLRYRKSLGYSGYWHRNRLLRFDRYLNKNSLDWDSFTPLLFLKFREQLSGEFSTINMIIDEVRRFFHFLVRREVLTHNPLQDIPRYSERGFIPFIFSLEDTDRLVDTICKKIRKTDKHFFWDVNVYMITLLLARCGLRISEPFRLKCHHYRETEGTIYIERTKFKKDRLIPLPDQVNQEIKNYLALRNTKEIDTSSLFILKSPKRIYPHFNRAVREIGLHQEKQIIKNTIFGAPTPHSLRHSFAVNTLKNVRLRGKSPQAALPFLAAYLGHICYQYTAHYLKALDADDRNGLFEMTLTQWSGK